MADFRYGFNLSLQQCLEFRSFDHFENGKQIGYQQAYTVFENHRKSIIQHCERSELCLHFEWTKWAILVNFENLKLVVKQCYQTGQF